MALQPLPKIGGNLQSNFISIGGGGGLPGITFPGGGPVISSPPVVIGGSGSGGKGTSGTPPVATSAGAGSVLSGITSFISCLMSPGDCLLRLVMLIIGLICIIGAIYLFKPTQQIVAAPLAAAKEGVKGVAAGLAAA